MVEINGKQFCENCFEEITTPFCTHCGYNPAEGIYDPTMLVPGSVLLGKYIVGRIMGKGGFGVTYLAYDVTAGRKVAIKEFFPYGVALRASGTTTVSVSSMDNAEAFKLGAEKFYNEAKLVSKFNGNPNIVGVYEFFYENDTVYFAMEYLKGHTLKEHILEIGTLSAGQALFIAQNVANALMAAHSSNVLHRDISPDNIIICDNGEVKLIDFGAARQVVAEHSQSFSVILKPGFAPLEQYQKKGNQGPWTDIYSLGATLYFALTEDIPEDPMSRLDDDEEYSSNKYNIDPELWKVISKATELKIEDRYGDIFRLKNDLANISVAPEPLVDQNEQSAEKMPEFRTAVPYGMTQTVPRTANQPVGVGAPISAPVGSPDATHGQSVPNAASGKKLSKGKIAAICGGAAAVAAAIIIPIAVTSANKDKPDTKPNYSYTQSNANPGGTSFPVETVTNKQFNNFTYTGEWANNMPNGQGEGVDNTNGKVYKGEWKDGKPNGQGTLTLADGSKYVGEFKDGNRNGKGKETYADGDVYEGEFKDDKKDGQGTYTWADGKVYVGELKDGVRNGKGKLTYADGAVYVGEWKDDKRHGQGTYTSAKGDKYEGEFKDNKYNGQGTYTWASGGKYVGEFKDGVRNGYGKYTDKDGKVQEGQWKDDKFVGAETVTNQKYNHFTYTGEWANNKPNGQGKGVFDNGDVYEGEWKDGWESGYGVYTWADGDKYVGEWVDGAKTGQGTFTWAGGDKFVGVYRNDKRDGKGTYYFASGSYFEGVWKVGKKNGTFTYYDKNGKVTKVEKYENDVQVS